MTATRPPAEGKAMAEVERRTGIKVDHADASNRTEPPGPRVSRHHGRTSLWLHGEQDIATVPLLAAALTAVVADHRGDVVVDLAMVDFIDASTVGVLVRGQRLLRFQSRNLRLRSPSRFARRVLELCGLTHLIEDGSSSTRAPESRRVACSALA